VAFSFDEPTGGLGRKRFRRTGTLSEINIIPLVDVVLVLLIIFMLTAHVMEFGLEVDVPKVKQTRNTNKELPVISVKKTGESYLNEKPVNINLLGQEVRKRFPGATEVYLRADKETIFDALAQVINALNEAKLKVNVVLQPEDKAGRG
jgi:biopolymer transport protein ExbD